MSGTRVVTGEPVGRHRPFGRLAAGVVALVRGAALCAVASVGAVPPLAMFVVARILLDDGTRRASLHGPYHTWLLLGMTVLGLAVVRVRWVVRHTRRLVGKWCGVAIAEPYRPVPETGRAGGWSRIGRLLSDPATWRDLLWTGLNAAVCAWLLLSAAAGTWAWPSS